jgi:Tol biopolymer transport system component
MKRRHAWLLSAALSAAWACGGDGGSGPNGSSAVGPIGPFPSGVTGKIAFNTSASITSGGRAYTETKLHVIDVATSADRVIFTGQDVYVEALSWAPDGEHVVMQTWRPQPVGPNGENRDIRQLELLSAAGGGATVLFDANGPEYHPAYARDGRLAYFARWITDPTSGIFVDGQSVHPGPWDNNSFLSWSPAGDALAFTCCGFGLERLTLSEGTIAQLLAPENQEALTYPAWSPDGTRIALVRFGGSRQGQEIWTLSANGGDARQLTTGFSDAFPQWTPGGSYLAFTRYLGTTAGIYLIAPSGGAPLRIVGTGNALAVMAWSQ